jgi:nicotinate-nucleotide adenylyltransferase
VVTRAIFGGSFDPPHVGHVLAAEYILMTEMAQRVTVVPVFAHAFDKHMVPFEDRLALTRAAFGHLPRVEVSDVERDLPTPSYTVRTLEELTARHPDDQLRLLVGADVLSDVSRWVRFDEVRRLAPLLVLGRVGAEAADHPLVLPEISSSQVRIWLAQRPLEAALADLGRTVPAAVLREIEARRLYLDPTSPGGAIR